MIKTRVVEELEDLVANLLRMLDAEDAATEVFPEALNEIRDIINDIVKEIVRKAPLAIGRRPSMGASSKVPLEVYERYFYVLRLAAEAEWVRSHKLTGRESKKARNNADRLAGLTRQAAHALMVIAKTRKIWSLGYIKEHGLEPWV